MAQTQAGVLIYRLYQHGWPSSIRPHRECAGRLSGSCADSGRAARFESGQGLELDQSRCMKGAAYTIIMEVSQSPPSPSTGPPYPPPPPLLATLSEFSSDGSPQQQDRPCPV
jgi:hypothetical protein